MTDSSAAWYVVYTKPGHEYVAEENLLRQGFEVYLPLFKVFKKKRRGTKSQTSTAHEPMFPRYLFLRPTRPEQSLSVVRSTVGVSRLVMFGAQPAILHDTAVRSIREAQALREDAEIDEVSAIRPGMTVRIKDNALADLQALVQIVAKERVTLLLELLGRPQKVRVQYDHVKPL